LRHELRLLAKIDESAQFGRGKIHGGRIAPTSMGRAFAEEPEHAFPVFLDLKDDLTGQCLPEIEAAR
jgi:hypothetical protein